MKALLYLLLVTSMIVAGCLEKPSSTSEVKIIANADTVQSKTYSPVMLLKFKTIALNNLPKILMGKGVKTDNLCLFQKVEVEDQRKFWCIACDTSMGVRFVEDYHKEPHTLLLIKKDTITLDKMHFQFESKQDQQIGDLTYWFNCDDVRQILLNQDSFLTFSASLFMCNGSFCGYGFEFLYHINARQLYAFEHFRSKGYFGDVNQDMVLDYMELNPKSPEILDTISLNFYTLNTERRVFEPLKDEKGDSKTIWLSAVGEDIFHDYRFAKKLKVIQNPQIIN